MSEAGKNTSTSTCQLCNQASLHTTCLACTNREFDITARLIQTILKGTYPQIASRSAKLMALETRQKELELETKDLREEARLVMNYASSCLGKASTDMTKLTEEAASAPEAGPSRNTTTTAAAADDDDDKADEDQLKYWNDSARRHLANAGDLLSRAEAADEQARVLKQAREVHLPEFFRLEDEAWNKCLCKSRELYGYVQISFGPVRELMAQVEKDCGGDVGGMMEGGGEAAGAADDESA